MAEYPIAGSLSGDQTPSERLERMSHEKFDPIGDAKKVGHAIAETVRGAFERDPGEPPKPKTPSVPQFAGASYSMAHKARSKSS